MNFQDKDYKDVVLDQSALSAKEIQLLMLLELRGVNEKLKALDQELQEVSKKSLLISDHGKRLETLEKDFPYIENKVYKLEKFRTQVITALVIINIIWTTAIAVIKVLV